MTSIMTHSLTFDKLSIKTDVLFHITLLIYQVKIQIHTRYYVVPSHVRTKRSESSQDSSVVSDSTISDLINLTKVLFNI